MSRGVPDVPWATGGEAADHRSCKPRGRIQLLAGDLFSKWLLAIHLLAASKKGMSAHQFHRMLGITYKSAWFMAHRLRYAMENHPAMASLLSGIVEADETYVGGKNRRHAARPSRS